jgi:hypothetical protein
MLSGPFALIVAFVAAVLALAALVAVVTAVVAAPFLVVRHVRARRARPMPVVAPAPAASRVAVRAPRVAA